MSSPTGAYSHISYTSPARGGRPVHKQCTVRVGCCQAEGGHSAGVKLAAHPASFSPVPMLRWAPQHSKNQARQGLDLPPRKQSI
jgi:hypothetical protein